MTLAQMIDGCKVDRTPILIKTMKDGSKRYRSLACPKCGGTGYLRGYEHIDNARCWKCNASGYAPYEWTEPSEERIAKQMARNKAKRIAEAPKHNAEFLADHGFNENGKAYVVLGDTFAIKDDLKAMGGKFDYITGWKLPNDTDKYPTVEIDIAKTTEKDEDGWISFIPNTADIIKYIEEIENSAKPVTEEQTSEYVGNVGDKITIDVIVVSRFTYDTHYSYYGDTSTIFKFKDKNGNIFIWNTASYPALEDGMSYSITATIKEHKEYKGEKETVLIRCKVK